MNLVYLADARTGGWASFTGHLYRGMQEAGGTPRLFMPAKRTESKRRMFTGGIPYQNISLTALATLPDLLILAAAPKHIEELGYLVGAGATVVVHDPTECTSETLQVFRMAPRVITMRKLVLEFLQGHDVEHAERIPLPYMRRPYAIPRQPEYRAVCYSRIDFDKHTDIILDANTQAPGVECHLWGAVNRLYTHHKLTGWPPAEYHEPMPRDDLWAGVRIAQRGHEVVDMSEIKQDGRGVQYTHLEALDAGRPLILNAAWGHGELDVVARYVKDAQELADVLAGGPRPLPERACGGILREHDAAHVARSFMTREGAPA